MAERSADISINFNVEKPATPELEKTERALDKVEQATDDLRGARIDAEKEYQTELQRTADLKASAEAKIAQGEASRKAQGGGHQGRIKDLRELERAEARARKEQEKAAKEAAKEQSKIQKEQEKATKAAAKEEAKAARAAAREAKAAQADAKKGEQQKKADAKEYGEFRESFGNEQEVLETAARKEATAKAKREQDEHAAAAKKEYERRQALTQERQAAVLKDSSRGRLHDMGLIDARSDYEKARDRERNGGGMSGMLGTASRFMPHALMATAGGAAAMQGIHATTHAANTLQNSDLTFAQKKDSILDNLTFGLSKSLRDLGNALDGTTERIRRSNVHLEQQRAVSGEAYRGWEQQTALTDRHMLAQQRAGILEQSSVSPAQQFDRSTLAGATAHRNEQQRLPARDALAEAEREAWIARAGHSHARSESAAADERYQDAQRRRGRAQLNHNRAIRGELRGGRNAAGRTETNTELQLAQQEERAMADAAVAARQRMETAGVRGAQAEAAARERNIEAMRTELSIAQQRTQRMENAAERLGGMNVIDRRMAMNAALMAQRNGIGSLTAEMRQRAQSIAPEWFRQQQQNLGEGTQEFGELQRAGFEDFNGRASLRESRQEEGALQNNIRELALDNQRQLARQTADVLGSTLRALVDAFSEQVEMLRRELQTAMQRRNNST